MGVVRSEAEVWAEEGRLGAGRGRVVMLTASLKAPSTGRGLGYITKGNKGSTKQHLEIIHTLVLGWVWFFALSSSQ